MTEYLIHRDDTELAHFGTKGMKWGVRRYQNEDGSYKSGAEGRYAPDGKPGVNTGRTLKNRVKSALCVYKEGDGNPYVSEKRRKIRKIEEESYKEAQTKEAEKKAAKEQEKAEKLAKKREEQRKAEEFWAENINPNFYKLRGVKSKAEKEAEKAEKEKTKAEKKAAKEKEKAEKKAAKQKKEDERLSKDGYMNVLGRSIVRQIGINAASSLGGVAVAKITGNKERGYDFYNKASSIGRVVNTGKTVSEAYKLHKYRSKNKAKHSDYSEYELYHHGILGMHWGIRRYQNSDGTLTAEGKERYRTDKKFASKVDKETKIKNINKKQAGSYNYASQKRADVNNKHHNILSTAAMTYGDEQTYYMIYGKKGTKGAYDAGRTAANVALNYLYKKKYEQIAQDYALKEYNDDGSKKVREGSVEQQKLKMQRKAKQSALYIGMSVAKVASNVLLTELSRTKINQEARQPYDINGKWARSGRERSYTYRLG